MSHAGHVGHEDMQLAMTSEKSGFHDLLSITQMGRGGRNLIPQNHIQRSQQGNPPFSF